MQLRKIVDSARQLKRRFRSITELRIYSAALKSASSSPPRDFVLAKDRWADLEAFDGAHGWVPRATFLAEARKRLSASEHVYTLVERGRLVHYGWAAAGVTQRFIPDVRQVARFPEATVYLYDFFTHPFSRNRGIYQKSLRQILSDLAVNSDLADAYIGVAADNAASRRAVEKTGFVHQFSLVEQWKFFRVRRWSRRTLTRDVVKFPDTVTAKILAAAPRA